MFKINYLTLFYFGLDGWEFNFKVGGGSPLPGLWLTRPDLLAVAHALHISALVPILAAIPYNRVNIVTQILPYFSKLHPPLPPTQVTNYVTTQALCHHTYKLSSWYLAVTPYYSIQAYRNHSLSFIRHSGLCSVASLATIALL